MFSSDRKGYYLKINQLGNEAYETGISETIGINPEILVDPIRREKVEVLSRDIRGQ